MRQMVVPSQPRSLRWEVEEQYQRGEGEAHKDRLRFEVLEHVEKS